MITDLEEITVDYWYAAKAIRTGRIVTGDLMTGRHRILARTSLVEVHRDAPTKRLHDCARELCLRLGIVAVPVERHDGGSVA